MDADVNDDGVVDLLDMLLLRDEYRKQVGT
jgi:hypothetical protein